MNTASKKHKSEREILETEIRKNYQSFQKMEFAEADSKKFALLKKGKLIDILDTLVDADKMGSKLYDDQVYSIQQINPPINDLGYISYALHSNTSD